MNFFNNFGKSFIQKIFKLKIFDRILISYLSVPSKIDENIKILSNHKFKMKKNFYNNNIFFFTKLMNKSQKLIKLFPIGINLPPLAGNHFGSVLKNQIKENKNFKNIYFIDSSTLASIPVVPPTLITMMHSLNITKLVASKKFLKK